MTAELRFTVDDFMERTEGITRMEGRLDQFIHETVLYREAMLETLKEHGDQIKTVVTCVSLGNGEPSLKEQVHTCAAKLEAVEKAQAESGVQKKEGRAARWQFWSAIVVAIISAFALIFVALSSGSSNTDADRLQASEVRQILQIVREEEAGAPSSIGILP
jgi:hypothetical protein